jgi:hypothetical protein
MDDYLREAVGRATKQEIVQRLGQPSEERHSYIFGGPLLIYRNSSGGYKVPAHSCVESLLSFDSNEILRDWDEVRLKGLEADRCYYRVRKSDERSG